MEFKDEIKMNDAIDYVSQIVESYARDNGSQEALNIVNLIRSLKTATKDSVIHKADTDSIMGELVGS